MEVIVNNGCGLDVHKDSVVACIMGTNIKKEIRSYDTFTTDLLDLKEWLRENKVTHVAMESTGVYWKPVFNILEDSFEVILVNAGHIKNVPGRKTDIKDSEWICKLLRNGLLRSSFIPPQDIRDMRDLTRYRKKLVQSISAEKNRIQKILEDANIKLSSVMTDIFGVSGNKIIDELIKDNLTIDEISELSKGRLKKKKEKIKQALDGNFRKHHKFMIETSLKHIESLVKLIENIDKQIDQTLQQYKEESELLQTIPGVKDHGAASIIAEIGTNMDKFPTAGHLVSWAGMCPGNNESAGKKKSGKIRKGNKNLKTTLIECAWGASKTKGTYFKSKYKSLSSRKGRKRALVAIGHKILIMCYFILKCKVSYKELGEDYIDTRKVEKIKKNYVKKLNNLGYKVILEEVA